jgi:pSer/pThr/pTyr-binding forkhead associated (FHA) protein
MNRTVKALIVITALLACGAAAGGLRRTLAQRGDDNTPARNSFAPAAASRAHAEVRVDSGDGPFVLKNLTLARVSGSTLIKGKLVNKTKRKRERVSFEVRAYDADGRIVRGLENITIFEARGLKADAAVPLNHGYGIWLQGVPFERVARIEISEMGEEAGSLSALSRLMPLASHALRWERDSEMEE